MAWIAVRTDSGEELASWEIQSHERWGWWPDMDQAIPGLTAAVQHALELDEREREARQRGR